MTYNRDHLLHDIQANAAIFHSFVEKALATAVEADDVEVIYSLMPLLDSASEALLDARWANSAHGLALAG